jgi:uncharacterized protein (TIGR03437 family)
MGRSAGLSLLLCSIAAAQGLLIGPPVDSAAYRLEGSRFAGIARGGMFTVFTNGGPVEPVVVQSLPVGTTLGGVSMRIQVEGQTCEVPMLIVARTQATGVACSNLPVGTGTITYTFNGLTAPAQPIRIVEHNPTIFTNGATGEGSAAITHADNRRVTQSDALHPNDVFVVWFQGGGALPADDQPSPGDLRGQLNPRLLINDQPAVLDYFGGSGCCAGLWQLVARVPAEPTFGCFVPIHLNQGDTWSNNVSIPIAPAGQNTCGDAHGFDPAGVEAMRSNGMLYFPAVFGGYSFNRVPFANLNQAPADPVGLFSISGEGQLPSSFFALGLPNAVGSCQVRVSVAGIPNLFSPEPVLVQGGSGIVLTLTDSTTANVQTGFDPQNGIVISQTLPAALYARTRSARVNDSAFATPFGQFSLTGVTIEAAPPPRVDRSRLTQDLLDPVFRQGRPPREGPFTLVLSEAPPAGHFLQTQIFLTSGALTHIIDCTFQGGQTAYAIPERFFANISDSANGFTGGFVARVYGPPARRVLAPGSEVHAYGESILSIEVVR